MRRLSIDLYYDVSLSLHVTSTLAHTLLCTRTLDVFLSYLTNLAGLLLDLSNRPAQAFLLALAGLLLPLGIVL